MALLMACASNPRHAVHGDLRFVDTETVGKTRHAAALAREIAASNAARTVASKLAQASPVFAKMVETVSREQEARFIAQGCTDELRGTIKPDLVLHAERDLLKAVLILDFKFPCPDTNPPQWTRYGNSSPYAGRTQEDVYQTALGGAARLISPSKGVVPP